jgi:hypothetical protein
MKINQLHILASLGLSWITRFRGQRFLCRQGTLGVVALLFLAGNVPVSGQNHASVPGVIINEIPAPSALLNAIYVSDPSIVVLSNGDYLASHAQFGNGSGSESNGLTQVFRSTDKGQTWTKVNGGNNLSGILRGSLFEHNGAVYLSGSNHDSSGSNWVMMRSNNVGDTWSAQSFTSGGFATPDNLIAHNNRLWLASTVSSASFAATSDPYQEASWLRGGGFPALNASWMNGTFSPANNFIGEGQIAASPHLGVNILSKVRLLPYVALSSVNPGTGRVSFDPDMDFINLRGGEKKFAVRYDSVSEKYYMLANPNLPAHDNTSFASDLVRNTAAVYSSADLRHWRMEKIFLYSQNISYEGFQYFNFEFDGDDMVIASRTAFDVGGNRPPRGHDSNLLTFHRIEDFRDLEYQHVIRIQGGLVRRFERTGLSDAPLGNFPLGSQFAGSPLSNPDGIAYLDGVVYIRESGGRILAFDLMGNFLGVESEAAVTFQAGELDIPVASANQFSWLGLDDGDWAEPRNWFYFSPPQEKGATAIFGSAANANTVVTVPSRDRSWYFDQGSGFQGWLLTNISEAALSPEGLTGIVDNQDPYLRREHLNLDGNRVTAVRLRMRVDRSGSIPVDLYWANSTNDGYAEARRTRLSYSGDGEFQDLIFEMEGQAQWANERITRLRIDPTNGAAYAGARFHIQSVVIETEHNQLELAGLNFNNQHSYTLTGGALRINNDNATALIDVRSGAHAIEVPVAFRSDTQIDLSEGSELTLSQQISAVGELHISGGGLLNMTGDGQLGRVRVSAHAEVNLGPITFDESGAIEISSGATVRLLEDAVYPVSELRIEGDLKWPGTWGAVGSGADYESETISGPGLFNVTSGPEPGYAGWAWVMGLTADEESSAYWQDPDGDGVVNLLEWFLGGNPLDGMSQALLPRIERLGDSLQFSFSRSKEAKAGLQTIFQYSETLKDPWAELLILDEGTAATESGISVEIVPQGDDMETVIVVMALSDESSQRLFMRLRLLGGLDN